MLPPQKFYYHDGEFCKHNFHIAWSPSVKDLRTDLSVVKLTFVHINLDFKVHAIKQNTINGKKIFKWKRKSLLKQRKLKI